MHDLHTQRNSVTITGSKALKYQKPIPRPTSFDALAKTLTKMSGNPQTYDHLKNLYADEIRNFKSEPPMLRMPAPRGQGPASLMPTYAPSMPSAQSSGSTSSLPQPVPFPDANLPTGFAPPPFQPYSGNGNGNGNGSSSDATSSTDDGIRLPGDPRRNIDDELDRRATELLNDMPATPMSFPRLDEDEYRRRSSGSYIPAAIDNVLDEFYPPGDPDTREAYDSILGDNDALDATGLGLYRQPSGLVHGRFDTPRPLSMRERAADAVRSVMGIPVTPKIDPMYTP
jgi:hypothetical protein